MSAIAGQVAGFITDIAKGSIQQEWNETSAERDMQRAIEMMGIEDQYGRAAEKRNQDFIKAMYDQSKHDTSYAERVKQMELAGLNPALMMAGGAAAGAGGAGATSTSNSPQKPAQGSRGRAAMIQMSTAAEMMQASKQTALLESEIEVNKSVAEKNRADAGLSGAQTKTTEETREAVKAELIAKGQGEWIDNMTKRTKAFANPNEEWTIGYKHWLYEEVIFNSKAGYNRETAIGLLQGAAIANAQQATAALDTEKAKNYFYELTLAAARNDTEAAKAEAMKLEAETRSKQLKWETGELVTWKTWYNMGIDVVGLGLDIVGAVKGTKALPQHLEMPDHRPKNSSETTTKYNANGKETGSTQTNRRSW